MWNVFTQNSSGYWEPQFISGFATQEEADLNKGMDSVVAQKVNALTGEILEPHYCYVCNSEMNAENGGHWCPICGAVE